MIQAARLARTPLAIADATASAAILFANDAFAQLLGRDPAQLVGQALDSLAAESQRISAGATVRLDVVLDDGRSFPAALSVASVTGPEGDPFCLLCSLVETRGEGADAAIARDAVLLAEVARAASDLMRESGMASKAAGSPGDGAVAADIALEAVERAAPVDRLDG